MISINHSTCFDIIKSFCDITLSILRYTFDYVKASQSDYVIPNIRFCDSNSSNQ